MQDSAAVSAAGGSRIGLAALCANWFREVGLQGDSSDLSATVQRDYARMAGFLGECFGHVIAPGVISTVDEAIQAARRFREERADALVLVHIMWSEDQPLLALLDGTQGLPVLLWNYHPTGRLPDRLSIDELLRLSGTVGMLQGSAPLQRRGLRLPIVSGTPGEPDLARELCGWDRALGVRRAFRGMSAGRIAGRCEVMTGTYVDENALRETLGVRLVDISVAEYAEACAAVDVERIKAFHADLTGAWPVAGVSEESLRLACRNTLALDNLVLRYDLRAMGIQDLDPELHRLVGVRPCLCPPVSAERGVPFAMESDLHTALGMLAGMRAAASPAMYTEVLTFDPQENVLLMGHAAVHDPRLASPEGVTLVPDAEYRHSDRLEGAWQEFIMAEGPVTCVSLYDAGHGYRLTAFEGASLGGPRRLEGYAHALVCPDVHVLELLPRLVRRGMTQHFGVVPGRIASVLAKWCTLAGIEFRLEA